MSDESPVFVPHSRLRRLMALMLAVAAAVGISRVLAIPSVYQACMLGLLKGLDLLGAETGDLAQGYQNIGVLVPLRGAAKQPSAFVAFVNHWAYFVANCVPSLLAGVLIYTRLGARRLQRSVPICRSCGYLTFGITSDRCPECGSSTVRTALTRSQRLRPWLITCACVSLVAVTVITWRLVARHLEARAIARWRSTPSFQAFQTRRLLGQPMGTEARGVSGDGLVAVGRGYSGSKSDALRWTYQHGADWLGDAPSGIPNSRAAAASYDGRVIVGRCSTWNGLEAFRWTEQEGMIGLGVLPGSVFESEARDVSGDGTVVVGATASGRGRQAFRWTTADGLVGLGDLSGGVFFSEATAVSGDGAVVVGFSNGAACEEAFRWTLSEGMVSLGDLRGGPACSRALDVSSDGATIVGCGMTEMGRTAFRWTASSGMVALEAPFGGPWWTDARAVSGDGSVVVGVMENENERHASIWDETHGMRKIRDELVKTSSAELARWTLDEVNGISDDGTVIVGHGTGPGGSMEAWVAVIPRTASGDRK